MGDGAQIGGVAFFPLLPLLLALQREVARPALSAHPHVGFEHDLESGRLRVLNGGDHARFAFAPPLPGGVVVDARIVAAVAKGVGHHRHPARAQFAYGLQIVRNQGFGRSDETHAVDAFDGGLVTTLTGAG